MSKRVLFLTHLPPYPASSGDAVRNLNLIRQLAGRGWLVSLFSLAPDGLPDDRSMRALREICEHVVCVQVPSTRLRRALRVGHSTLLRRAYQPDYFWDERAARALGEHLARHSYDLHMAQIVYMARYAALGAATPTVLDTHNAEGDRLASMAQSAGWSPRGLIARLQSGPSRRMEAEIAGRLARILAVSEDDQRYFEALAPGRVDLVPNGVDTGAIPARELQPGGARVLFLGSLDYSANVDAVRSLITGVLPLVTAPDVTVDVAGRNPPASLVRLGRPNVAFHGFVPDLAPLSEQVRLMVVPLRFGGGTRLKILDAFARGIPVVSTSAGCAGLGVKDGEHLLIADEPQDFAAAIDRLIRDDELCRRLAIAGRTLAEQRFNWQGIGAELDHVLRGVVGEGDDDASIPIAAA